MTKNKWNKSDDLRLIELINERNDLVSIADSLGVDAKMVLNRVKKLDLQIVPNNHRTWTAEHVEELQEKWGRVSINAIASSLGRTVVAVKMQARKLRLGEILDCTELLKISEFSEYSGISRDRLTRNLYKKHGFPLKKRLVGASERRYYFVDIHEAEEWMKSHQDLFDATLISEHLFIEEPEWLVEKRKRDSTGKVHLYSGIRRKVWKDSENAQLRDMVRLGIDYDIMMKQFDVTRRQLDDQIAKLNLSYRIPNFYKGEEFKYIQENWKTQTDEEMAKALGRTVISITKHRNEMGLKRTRRKKPFTKSQITYIKNHLDMTDKEIAKHIGHTESSVNSFRVANGITKGIAVKWTQDELDFIHKNHVNMTDKEIGEQLNKPPRAVQTQRKKYGWLRRKRPLKWTKEENEYLLANLDKTDKEIGEHIGKTEVAVREHRQSLGFIKTRDSAIHKTS